ncbi:MAG: hypothetical protein B5M53_07365 [Candidatus Cloacimonas sp. 4484_209]|nr:MAG: hypothetical protein B5M53_07365 [Candidatus Cloacimonas sp. 4484_209]RKX38811.1 MAG: hypothetical protein DRP23_06005 [Thermotogota bacterium]
MKKYLLIALNTIKESAEFRLNHILSFLTIALPFVFVILLWKKVFIYVYDIKGFTLSDIITYYFFSILLQDLMYVGVNWEILMDIKDGKLSLYLVKPIKYPVAMFFIRLGVNIPYFLSGLIILSFYLIWIKEYFIFQTNFVILGLFFLTTFLAFVLAYIFTFTFSILSFWLEEISGVNLLINVFMPILTGLVLPLSMFPSRISSILKILPFRYTLNFPIVVYLGKLSTYQVKTGILIQIFWILSGVVIAHLLWSKGLKRYQAVGG